MVNVPKDTKHWFDLCDDKTIRCIRLFQDPAGWTPHYVHNPINENYIPVCLGPNFIPPKEDDNSDPVVRV
jgi:1,2-dihydroxy-3-keto-5-methylthiopentene dioxygenase